MVVGAAHWYIAGVMHLFRIAVGAFAMLLLVTQFAYAAVSVSGVVRGPSGAPIRDADVSIATADRARFASVKSDARGGFKFDVPTAGTYLITVSAPGFGESRVSVTAGPDGQPIEITLSVHAFEDEVTVTAAAGLVQDIRTAGQPVNVIYSRAIAERVDTVVAQAVQEEAGVQLQRTSPTMAGRLSISL